MFSNEEHLYCENNLVCSQSRNLGVKNAEFLASRTGIASGAVALLANLVDHVVDNVSSKKQ